MLLPVDTNAFMSTAGKLCDRVVALETALQAIRDEIDGMADVKDGESGPKPNVFMKIDTVIDTVLPA